MPAGSVPLVLTQSYSPPRDSRPDAFLDLLDAALGTGGGRALAGCAALTAGSAPGHQNCAAPPSLTVRGLVTWVHSPSPEVLRLCREVDVIAALRTALKKEQSR